MPVDVNAAFEQMHSWISSSASEREAAKLHRASIQQKLTADFRIQRFFRSGSFGNGTSVSAYSDVDYFAVLPPTPQLPNSGSLLARVAQSLRDRFSSTPNIRVNEPGVQVPFGQDKSEFTEVIPAFYAGTLASGASFYRISDSGGGWTYSAPELYRNWIDALDARLNYRVKPLIRFIKAWNYYRSAGIRSWYLELRTAYYASTQPAIVYDIDVAAVLSMLHREGLRPLADTFFATPTYVTAANTNVQHASALQHVDRAHEWAQQARNAKDLGRTREAFDRWDLVFNRLFPSYGY